MEYPNATIVRKKPDNLKRPATKSYEERLHEYRIGVRKKFPKKKITEKKVCYFLATVATYSCNVLPKESRNLSTRNDS